MSEADLTLVMRARNLASREVERLHQSLGRVPGSAKRAGGALLGLAKTAGILAGGGLLAIIGGLALATKAAAEEEKGIARMNQAIAANDRAWRGNSDSVEKIIADRERLGFSDDALRDSITILVSKTHDLVRAQDLQATAMDLARLKGISLTDASTLLTKGLDGNQKILKQLGIDLPKTATQQQRLTAIQKVAAGQAKKYGETAAGAQEAFQIAVGDLVEDLGSTLLPVMKTLFTWLREKGIPAVRGVIAAIGKWMHDNRPLIDQITKFAGTVLKRLVDFLGQVVTWIGKVVTEITSNKDAMRFLKTVFGLIADALGAIIDAGAKVLGFIGDLVDKIRHNQAVVAAFKLAWTLVAKAIGKVVEALKDVIHFAQRAFDWLGKIKVPDIRLPFTSGGFVGAGSGGSRAAISGGGGVVQLVIDGRVLGEIMDARLYATLQRAAPTQLRS